MCAGVCANTSISSVQCNTQWRSSYFHLIQQLRILYIQHTVYAHFNQYHLLIHNTSISKFHKPSVLSVCYLDRPESGIVVHQAQEASREHHSPCPSSGNSWCLCNPHNGCRYRYHIQIGCYPLHTCIHVKCKNNSSIYPDIMCMYTLL